VVINPAMQAAHALIGRAASNDLPVLLLGETGVGKEILARELHQRGRRRTGPFKVVNCGAIPPGLLESTLFGHERGAFTDARCTNRGVFEQASGGTLFLDEIGDVSLATQAKLLRVLQDQEFHRLGGTRSLRTDARVVAATNKDLRRAIAAGEFREDLYFRVNVITIELPSLRERADDIDALAQHFLAEFAAELGRPRSGFSAAALARIRAHDWPGNVRELRNVLERALLVCDHEAIEVRDLRFSLGAPPPEPTHAEASLNLEEMELRAIEASLRLEHGRVEDAARRLGISRSALYLKIKKLGLKPSKT
jgi:Nif-specific regulatory protein